MPLQTTLHIAQEALKGGKHAIQLTLERPDQPKLTAKADIKFALTPPEQEELRWYMEDYLTRAESVQEVQVKQVEEWMKRRGEELYTKVLAANMNTQALWFAVREQLANLRVEITTGIAEAASIPWELMRDPQSDSAIALRVQSFVRVQSNPNISFVPVPEVKSNAVRMLMAICRPGGEKDIDLRTDANTILQEMGEDRSRYEIKVLRPPTFEQLQKELNDAKQQGRPYHIVHFDGHGTYADLSGTSLEKWLLTLNHLRRGDNASGKHGFLLFEHPGSKNNMRPVDGHTFGQVLHDAGVPVVILNACQSAMHEAVADKKSATDNVHDEVRTIGSLAQVVIDQGIPAVLGMRYSVFVVTAAQYIGQLYAALAHGRPFGQAASEGRKHLALNPDRWVGLQPRPLQDWFVPVVYEAAPIQLLLPKDDASDLQLNRRPELDPVLTNRALRRYVPDTGFVGRDETLLLLDRAFDEHPVVLLHAYAGQGKTATAVEFARWYAQTGGLGLQPVVLLTSFETHTDLTDVLNQIGQQEIPDWSSVNEIDRKCILVIQQLRKKPVLWIWNNVEPVAGFPAGTESAWTLDEQADLADFLKQIKLDRATKAKILLTSRQDEQTWLGGIPHRAEMPRMRNSDAAKLARSLSSAKKITDNEIADWQPLLDYCHGNPLTLRVVVSQAIKMRLRGREQIRNFVEAIRSGEQAIEDADEKQGRDKSLGASLDYGFRNAFKDDQLPIIALLHLFQGTINVGVLQLMGTVKDHAPPDLKGKTTEQLTGLFERAKDTGLLTQIGPAYFTIHPALPWFLRQLFARYWDGQAGRSTAQTALRAWIEAVGELGTHCAEQFSNGNRGVIDFLKLEEANLLHARRLARRNQWWQRTISVMQALKILYEYQGRMAEWARLVEEIRPNYCTADNEAIPGRENQYSLVMGYRVDLANDHERDLGKAAALQEKRVKWNMGRAASALALAEDAAPDPVQCNRLRTLAGSLVALGEILGKMGNRMCVQHFQEATRIFRRIGDKAGEAVVELNLGHAYMNVFSIRDLAAAEAAYQRSLALRDPTDTFGCSGCISQIGEVHSRRLLDALERGEREETLLRHAQTAEKHYLIALRLCPSDGVANLALMHSQLGSLYSIIGQLDKARKHLEQAVQHFKQSGDGFFAGHTRFSMALMYGRAAERENQPSQQRAGFLCAQAYAEAALRDFQHYPGHAADLVVKAKELLADIAQALAKLPP